MTDDHHLWVRPGDVRPDFEAQVDRGVVIGDDDDDPRIARIVAIDDERNVELEVLPDDGCTADERPADRRSLVTILSRQLEPTDAYGRRRTGGEVCKKWRLTCANVPPGATTADGCIRRSRGS